MIEINRCLFVNVINFIVGFQLVSFDYSQLELRVLAHLSNDDKLKTRLINNTDFFISLAADLLKKSEHEITREQRQNAKQV
jgi:DNA polymerase-1